MLVERLRRGLRVAAIRVDVQGTPGGRVVEQQHAGHDVFGLHGARDGAVGNEVLRGALRMIQIRFGLEKRSHFVSSPVMARDQPSP